METLFLEIRTIQSLHAKLAVEFVCVCVRARACSKRSAVQQGPGLYNSLQWSEPG